MVMTNACKLWMLRAGQLLPPGREWSRRMAPPTARNDLDRQVLASTDRAHPTTPDAISWAASGGCSLGTNVTQITLHSRPSE
jgi:hypothetical protein